MKDQNDLLTRMVHAAESWAQVQFGWEMEARPLAEPVAYPGGTLVATVELVSPQTAPQRIVCFTTLEPDGSIGCFKAGEFPARD